MTSLLLIFTDKTTGGFTRQVCNWHIVSRCERKEKRKREDERAADRRGGEKTESSPLKLRLCSDIFTGRITGCSQSSEAARAF